MKFDYELLIIGAGAAGMSAAITASKYGIKTAVFDEQAAIGGQIYRGIESVTKQRGKYLGDDYLYGQNLATDFRNTEVDYFPNTQVWSLKPNEISIVQDDKAQIITANQIIVANGAMERPVPFKGWTLAGVMNAGAGQILFKSAGVVPKNGVVLAGSGALLLLLAAQYVRAGIKIKALLDMSLTENHFAALSQLPKALLASNYLLKGAALKQELKLAGIPMFNNVTELQALGNEAVEAISFEHQGKQKTLETDLLLIHFGIIPNIWLTQAAGCQHLWDESQQCFKPKSDKWGRTSLDGILVAGDGAGINGAKAAEYAGHITALQAIFDLGQIDKHRRNRLATKAKKALQKERAIRPFLEAWFRIPRELLLVKDNETIVCRCEEVTAGEIRDAVAKGHNDSNQVKFLTRCGMGACQGRQCANAVAQIVADEIGKPIQHAGLYRGRPPVTPLTLGQLADLFSQEGE